MQLGKWNEALPWQKVENFQGRRGRWCTCLTSRTQHWSDGIEKDATPSSSALTNMAKLGMHNWRLSVWHHKALAGGRHFFTTKNQVSSVNMRILKNQTAAPAGQDTY
jgi:hypothetical protein